MDKKFQAWLKGQLRRVYYKMPNSPASKAWTEARVGYGLYRCAHCTQVFGPKEMRKDHIDPVDNVNTGFISWDDHVLRLFHGPIQILCNPCHNIKSKTENSDRRKRKKKNA